MKVMKEKNIPGSEERKSTGVIISREEDVMNRDEVNCNCSKCAIIEKICRVENGKGPAWCPTKTESDIVQEALRDYEDAEVKEFARLASVQEGSCYAQREVKPFLLIPTKSRIEELMEFSQRMWYKRLGLAFCGAMIYEAAILSKILEKNGFEIVSVSCVVGGVPKEKIGVKDGEKVRIGEFDSMCNPIAQARILNRAKTDFNIMLGLCIGHDSLFLKYVKGLTTVFAVKDRVMGHNPLAALYTSRSYYQRLIERRKRVSEKKSN